MNILNGFIESTMSKRIRRCLYCKKIKLCTYIDYKIIEDEKINRGIKGSFCKDCAKLPIEDIFLKLKDKQYYIFKSIYANWDNTK
jgi:hypothetical protein